MTAGPPPSAARAPHPPSPPLRRPVSSAVSDEQPLVSAFKRLRRRVVFQTWTLLVCAAVLIFALPFSETIYLYHAVTPDRRVKPLVGLVMPNMTNDAILSWAATSVTEVLTMGFGDIRDRLPIQRARFTKVGWDAYMKTFQKMEIEKSFKESQLVLTAVPSNPPLIVRQGLHYELQRYQWVVQVPVVMTYATNNNVVRKVNSTVNLTIVRVPVTDTFSGIAIQDWFL